MVATLNNYKISGSPRMGLIFEIDIKEFKKHKIKIGSIVSTEKDDRKYIIKSIDSFSQQDSKPEKIGLWVKEINGCEILEKKIKIYGTKEGTLYIKPEELFALKKVQDIIKKASKLKISNRK